MTETVKDDILDIEVLLSNFEGRDRVSLREFTGYASMIMAEQDYRKGTELVVQGSSQQEVLPSEAIARRHDAKRIARIMIDRAYAKLVANDLDERREDCYGDVFNYEISEELEEATAAYMEYRFEDFHKSIAKISALSQASLECELERYILMEGAVF